MQCGIAICDYNASNVDIFDFRSFFKTFKQPHFPSGSTLFHIKHCIY